MRRESVDIRVATPQDAAALCAIYAPYVEKTAVTFEYETPTVLEFEERIRRILPRYPWLVAEQNGEIVGYAYASPFHARPAYGWAVETSIYVKMGVTKAGVGKALYGALEKALSLQNILNLNACIAYPEKEDRYLDKNSVQFHAHLGYRLVGEFHQCGYKFGNWYNMVWMEKLPGAHESNPPAVRTFEEIREAFEASRSGQS